MPFSFRTFNKNIAAALLLLALTSGARAEDNSTPQPTTEAQAASPAPVGPAATKHDAAVLTPGETAPQMEAEARKPPTEKAEKKEAATPAAPIKAESKKETDKPSTKIQPPAQKPESERKTKAEPARKVENGAKNSDGIIHEVGKNQNREPNFVVKRVVGDQTISVSKNSLDGQGRFVRGSVVNKGANVEKIKYVYVVRGTWFMQKIQAYIDRVYVQVEKSDRKYLSNTMNEVSRSFNYVCFLISTDNNSDKMLAAIARAIAVHRENAIKLQLQWSQKDEETAKLLDEYIRALWVRHEDFEKDKMIIPAGILEGTEYQSLEETVGVPRQ